MAVGHHELSQEVCQGAPQRQTCPGSAPAGRYAGRRATDEGSRIYLPRDNLPGWGTYGIVTRHPSFVAGALGGETDAVAPRTVPDRVHFCSGGTGGSADGPSSRTRGHCAGRSSIPHTGCVSGLCDGDLSGVLGDSWRSSAVHGGRGRALCRPGYLIDHRC
jgi:hypothetical protein